MNQTIRSACLLVFLALSMCCMAQQYSVGGGLIYNFSTHGLGLEVRTEHPLERYDVLEGIVLSPQFSFFPELGNDIEEIYLGISGHLNVHREQKWLFYTLVNFSWRGWLNYSQSSDENARLSRLAADAGIGVTRRACLRPFAELRLNVVGVEPSIRAGILYTIRCDIKGAVPCSKIPPQPQF